MTDPIILSENDANAAISLFNHWLDNEPVTLLVVTGKHQMAIQALAKANEMINSGTVFYKSVKVILAPEPSFIISRLQQLKVNPDLDPVNWTNIDQFTILSVSDVYNNIGLVISSVDFQDYQGGKINKLVRWAQAWDKQL